MNATNPQSARNEQTMRSIKQFISGLQFIIRRKSPVILQLHFYSFPRRIGAPLPLERNTMAETHYIDI